MPYILYLELYIMYCMRYCMMAMQVVKESTIKDKCLKHVEVVDIRVDIGKRTGLAN